MAHPSEKDIINPKGIDLSCPHCGGRDFFTKVTYDYEIHFATDDDNIQVYEREPGGFKAYQSIYCNSCGKRAFKRSDLESEGVEIPI